MISGGALRHMAPRRSTVSRLRERQFRDSTRGGRRRDPGGGETRVVGAGGRHGVGEGDGAANSGGVSSTLPRTTGSRNSYHISRPFRSRGRGRRNWTGPGLRSTPEINRRERITERSRTEAWAGTETGETAAQRPGLRASETAPSPGSCGEGKASYANPSRRGWCHGATEEDAGCTRGAVLMAE